MSTICCQRGPRGPEGPQGTQGPQGSTSFLNVVADGRLTVASGQPVPNNQDLPAQGTLFYTPYTGAFIALWDGAQWIIVPFTEQSIVFAGGNAIVANTNYDIFGFLSAGTLALDPPYAWASSGAGTSTRVAPLSRQDGVLVKNADPTRRYLGTIRASANNQTSDSLVQRFVWNNYNRVTRPVYMFYNVHTWTYSAPGSNVWREADDSNNPSTPRIIEQVVGVVDDAVHIQLAVLSALNSGADAAVGIGMDSLTSPDAQCSNTYSSIQTFVNLYAFLEQQPSIGYHFYSWLEQSPANASPTFRGFDGASSFPASDQRSALSGMVTS
jgi:hypothetical protein